MAQTLIRGSTQIMAGTVPWSAMASGAIVPTASLVDGANFLKKDGSVTMTAALNAGGFALQNLGPAINGTDAMTLAQGQALINGVSTRAARMIFTTNVALTGVQNTDGLTGAAGDVVWLNAQTTASQNGLWVMNAGAWTRPANWAAASTQKSILLFIQEGTTYHDTKWTVMTDAITVDTTSVTATQDTSGGTYTNGAGLSLTGNVFAVKLAAAGGLSFDGSNNAQIALNGSSLNLSASGLKISDGAAGSLLMANASGAATYTAMSGDATISSAGAVTVNTTAASGFLKYTAHVFSETPGGTVNGSNAAFTLASTPVASSLQLYLNGVRLEPGAGNDYTLSGAAITMLLIPQTGDKLRADYLK